MTKPREGQVSYEATDPRDRVFALLNIAQDTDRLGIRPDYTKSCKQIYTSVAETIVRKNLSLDLLSYSSSNNDIDGLLTGPP